MKEFKNLFAGYNTMQTSAGYNSGTFFFNSGFRVPFAGVAAPQ